MVVGGGRGGGGWWSAPRGFLLEPPTKSRTLTNPDAAISNRKVATASASEWCNIAKIQA